MKTQRERMLHEALRQIPYGLYVVGVRGGKGGEMNAVVASWVTQCSFEPPLILVALRKPSRSFELLKEGRVFTVNLVDKGERSLVRKLEKPASRAGHKSGKEGHFAEDTGAPILQKAFAFIECKVRAIHEPGDHALVVGEAVHAGVRGPGRSMTCADLKWHYGG